MYNFPLHINKKAFPPCTTTDLFRPTKAQRSITSCYTLFKLFIINENRHVIVGSSQVFDNFTPDIVQYFQYSLNSSKLSCERRNKMNYVQQPSPCSLVSQYFQYLSFALISAFFCSHQCLTKLGHLRTRGAGQHTRDGQDYLGNLTEPTAHVQFDQLYDLQLAGSSLAFEGKIQSVNKVNNIYF